MRPRGLIAISLTAWLPVRVKLLSSGFCLVAVEVAGQPNPLPDQEQPDASHPQFEPNPAERSKLLAVPGQPVGEQQDMASLLLDHRLEGIDQCHGEEAGAASELEQAEREETVDAFRVTGDEIAPFRIAGRFVWRRGFQLDAVAATRFDRTCRCRPSSQPLRAIASLQVESGPPRHTLPCGHGPCPRCGLRCPRSAGWSAGAGCRAPAAASRSPRACMG